MPPHGCSNVFPCTPRSRRRCSWVAQASGSIAPWPGGLTRQAGVSQEEDGECRRQTMATSAQGRRQVDFVTVHPQFGRSLELSISLAHAARVSCSAFLHYPSASRGLDVDPRRRDRVHVLVHSVIRVPRSGPLIAACDEAPKREGMRPTINPHIQCPASAPQVLLRNGLRTSSCTARTKVVVSASCTTRQHARSHR